MLGAVLGFLFTPYLTVRPINAARQSLSAMPLERLVALMVGGFLGLIAAALFAIPLSQLPSPLKEILPLATALGFCYLGAVLMMNRYRDLREFMSGARTERRSGFGGAGFGTGGAGGAAERGQDLEVVVTVSLEDLASDEKLRVSLPTGRTVDVKLPAGAEPDQQIRLRGLGHESPAGGQPGDAILTLRIASHPVFTRDGANLRLDLPVTLYDAALGAKVRAPTLAGSVNITVPSGSSASEGPPPEAISRCARLTRPMFASAATASGVNARRSARLMHAPSRR